MSRHFRSFIFSLTNGLYHLCEECYITMQHHTLIFKTEWKNISTRIIFSQFASCLTFIYEMNYNKETTEIKFPCIFMNRQQIHFKKKYLHEYHFFFLLKGHFSSEITTLKFIRWSDVLEIWFIGKISQSRRKNSTVFWTKLSQIVKHRNWIFQNCDYKQTPCSKAAWQKHTVRSHEQKYSSTNGIKCKLRMVRGLELKSCLRLWNVVYQGASVSMLLELPLPWIPFWSHRDYSHWGLIPSIRNSRSHSQPSQNNTLTHTTGWTLALPLLSWQKIITF